MSTLKCIKENKLFQYKIFFLSKISFLSKLSFLVIKAIRKKKFFYVVHIVGFENKQIKSEFKCNPNIIMNCCLLFYKILH